ncbi:MAG TPA: hypothetical protein VFT79_10820 [Solirubrobacterales bacterium]|nr:hypothetical protein [Solirubrobacterales bacterium]
MSELRIPLGGYARRIFWTVVGGACVLLILIRLWVLPSVVGSNPRESSGIPGVIDQSLGDILSTVIAATILSGVVVWLTRPSKKPTDLAVVHPKDIRTTLERNLKDTQSWTYSGSVGRWNRARVLPELAAATRRTNLSHSIVLTILDPWDKEACEAYATYRRGVRTGQGGDWSPGRVRCDLLATIVKAAVLCAENPLLDIRIALRRSSSILRVDASDKQLIITREDPSDPGIVCDRGTYFYDAFRQNMEFERKQAKAIIVFPPRRGDWEELTVDKTKELLNAHDLKGDQLSQSELESITAMAQSDDHPYGRS